LRHDSADSPLAASFTERKRRIITSTALDGALTRGLDVFVSTTLLLLLAPLVLVLAVAIKLESRGPVFYRCPRVGRNGSTFAMLKFRKMHDGASGPALASWDDERFTRIGAFLAQTKLDEIPQLWNVLLGQMNLVGPRPEDPTFISLHPAEFAVIHTVSPGMTGLSQIAFAREASVLDPEDRVGHYVRQILPQKVQIDQLYALQRSFAMDLRILGWTALAVLLRREIAVHRQTGSMNLRAPRGETRTVALSRTEV
jgi:lipopolysaccharide/colanic/teichoic acid biosynthesis glycosyltransferase